MPLPPLPLPEDRPVKNLDWTDERAIQAYLGVTDDGELARLAAIAAPKDEVFDARSLVDRAVALQVQVAEELVRRREVIASSMDYATLLRLAGQLGIYDVGYLNIMAKELIPDDPVKGPVLRRLSDLIWAMPPPKDFHNDFSFEDFSAALSLAASRTQLPRPEPDATLEEVLRYAGNVPTEKVSWNVLSGAFMDFLRIWYQNLSLPPDLFPKAKESGDALETSEIYQILLDHQQHHEEITSFHKTFKPGQEFSADIAEGAYRAYIECWESGIGESWLRRLAWLVVEFPPFWRMHGANYRAIHEQQIKMAGRATVAHRRKKIRISKKKAAAGEKGRITREAERWKRVTADFIESLDGASGQPESMDLQISAVNFVSSTTTLGKIRDRKKSLEFLRTLCTAVTQDLSAISVVKTLKQAQYKSLTEDLIRNCLQALKDASARAR